LFVTVIVNIASNPGVILADAVFTTLRSLEGITGTFTLLELFPDIGSDVLELIVAVFVRLEPL
jgi:hypothetical protein